MIGVLVVTHGQLSKYLLETASMFVSDTDLVGAVTFSPGQGSEDLEAAVREAVAEISTGDGILALVDLPGGTPAKAVSALLLENEHIEIVTGVNVPMLAEVLMYRESMNLQELMRQALRSGTDGIVSVNKMFQLEGGDL
ncbi:PTS sugar transporter subunit IIA [Paenibacillus hamazuiensis]|uniref:PTS sugar transporter subunit IIA n=1 Tax=Paenibacillus hamazuiensis TaxID=2936508 RepID=UPI00200DC186|nr:PTS sugar transporter subunit IIA [Paenibacillus hamazuiensis]